MKHVISHDFAMDILESISGLMVIDESERICFVSQGSARTLGYTRDELIGLPVQEVISNSELPRVLKENEPDWGSYFRVEGPGLTVDTICNRVPIHKGGKADGEIVGSLSYSSVPPGQDEDEVIKELEHLRRQNSMLQAHLNQIYSVDPDMEEIWGNSQQIRDVKTFIRQVAGTAATVCILGETGTGKELVANAIHKLSKRANRPFVKINCAAIPKNLIESELFGYEPGAFTGASRQGKIGTFELANGGTLLLDEIGEMPLELQVKLLRVLQNNEVTRVGGTTPIPIDVRIICSTNRDLRQMVDAGTFRSDLYYRINVMEIEMPPLRERPEDIPIFIMHFIDKANQRHDLNITGVRPEIYGLLQNYDWPGNVRELEHCIERACIICGSGLLQEEQFKLVVPQSFPVTHPAPEHARNAASFRSLQAASEREIILRALDSCHWNKSLAADVLHFSRSTLYNKMRKYRIAKENRHTVSEWEYGRR